MENIWKVIKAMFQSPPTSNKSLCLAPGWPFGEDETLVSSPLKWRFLVGKSWENHGKTTYEWRFNGKNHWTNGGFSSPCLMIGNKVGFKISTISFTPYPLIRCFPRNSSFATLPCPILHIFCIQSTDVILATATGLQLQLGLQRPAEISDLPGSLWGHSCHAVSSINALMVSPSGGNKTVLKVDLSTVFV